MCGNSSASTSLSSFSKDSGLLYMSVRFDYWPNTGASPARYSASSAVLSWFNTLLRWGNRPKRAMMSRCRRAKAANHRRIPAARNFLPPTVHRAVRWLPALAGLRNAEAACKERLAEWVLTPGLVPYGLPRGTRRQCKRHN